MMIAGCATHNTARLDATAALRAPSTTAAEPRASGIGVTSAARGDWWTAANLFEQATEGRDTPINRFNLAASYQQTGRIREAEALYSSVVRDGQFTKVVTVPFNADRQARDLHLNLADEAQRRLAQLELAVPAPARARAQTTGAQPRSAEQAAVPAAAIVGAAIPTAHITDAEAQRRDAAAEVR